MAEKLKVITPQNLGKGIKYNNETKQWESPDEYEQLDGYEFPKANDTHYIETYATKFRHIKTGYIHEAKKVELIPRGEHPAVKLTVSADPITIKWWSGKVTLNFKPYEVYFKENTSLGSFDA